ncbi:unnamed protein product, partial [Bubo scandiacus]
GSAARKGAGRAPVRAPPEGERRPRFAHRRGGCAVVRGSEAGLTACLRPCLRACLRGCVTGRGSRARGHGGALYLGRAGPRQRRGRARGRPARRGAGGGDAGARRRVNWCLCFVGAPGAAPAAARCVC